MELGKGLLVRFLAISCYNNYYHLFTLRPTIQTPVQARKAGMCEVCPILSQFVGRVQARRMSRKFKESHAISNMTRNRQKTEVYKDYKGSPEELDEVKVN
ncbi:hypothetical protein OS493_020707 [Desmophyllum pertusum]|uniref:Uncharacterized protein n=1 Tax=Desmophyllum pertusum TaxID=174260 RepID=A0A9W9YQQ4_9CNID|nr:hypothetical protein OS493_020707 [Desmophyllum pertusum]